MSAGDADIAVVQMIVRTSDPGMVQFTCTGVRLPLKVALQIIRLMEDAEGHEPHTQRDAPDDDTLPTAADVRGILRPPFDGE